MDEPGILVVFAVLWGLGLKHLLYIIPLAILCVVVAVWLLRKLYAIQRFAPIVLLVSLLTIVFWDIVLGKYYVKKLCDDNGLFAVNETVVLSNQFWTSDGWPKFHNKAKKPSKYNAYFLPEVLDDEYEIRIHEDIQDTGSFYKVQRTRLSLERVSTGKQLVYFDDYAFVGSWFARWIDGRDAILDVCNGITTAKSNVVAGSAFNHHLTSWVFLPEQPSH